MAEKERKYLYASGVTTKPVMIDTGKGPAAVVGSTVSKRLSDGKLFKGVRVSMGYKSDFGFNRNEYNGTVELPKGLNKEEKQAFMQGILDGWEKVEASLDSLDETKLVFKNA